MQTRRRRSAIAVAAAALALSLAAAGAAGADASAARTPATVELGDCHLALVELLDDPERASAFLPAGAPFAPAAFYGPAHAALSLWSFACAHVDDGAGPPRRAQLSLLSLQVEPPGAPPWPFHVVEPGREDGNVLYYLQRFDFWLHAAYSDDAGLAQAMRAVGLPATHTPHMGFARQDRLAAVLPEREDPLTLPHTALGVRAPGTGFDAEVRPWKQHPPHTHDNSWWHWTPRGGVARLRLRLLGAIDKWCAPHSPGCASLHSHGSAADFFGAPVRHDGLGIDHDLIPRGSIELSGGLPPP